MSKYLTSKHNNIKIPLFNYAEKEGYESARGSLRMIDVSAFSYARFPIIL